MLIPSKLMETTLLEVYETTVRLSQRKLLKWLDLQTPAIFVKPFAKK